jgi:hypothetical protein
MNRIHLAKTAGTGVYLYKISAIFQVRGGGAYNSFILQSKLKFKVEDLASHPVFLGG